MQGSLFTDPPAQTSPPLTDGRFGYTRSGLAVPSELAEARRVGGMVLDPVCGSGTMAVAALKNGRRCIVIDREPKAIEITCERVAALYAENGNVPMVRRDGRWHEVHRLNWLDLRHGVPDWDDGNSYIVLGDSIEVMRTMPDSFVELVYADPPFMKQQQFRGPAGSFDDFWEWDEAAEARMAELEDMPADRWEGDGKAFLLDQLRLWQRHQPDVASYCSWVALLLVECRRVMGATEYGYVPRGAWAL